MQTHVPMRFVANDKLILVKKTKIPINFQENIKRKIYSRMPKKLMRKLVRRWPIIYDYELCPYPEIFFTSTLRMTGHSEPLDLLIKSLMEEDMSKGLPESLLTVFKLGAALRGEGPLPVFPSDPHYQCSNCGSCGNDDPHSIGGTKPGDPTKLH